MDSRQRCRRNHRRDDLDRVVLDHADVRRDRVPRPAATGCRRPANARRCTGNRRPDAPARSSPSPRPCRTRSRARAAPRDRTRDRSRAARLRKGCRSAAADCRRARCCAGDMRPCRSTKLRTGRRGRGVASAGRSALTVAQCGATSPAPRACVRAGSASAAPAGVYWTTRVSASFHDAVESVHVSAGFHEYSLRTPSRVTAPHRELVDAALARRSQRSRGALGPATGAGPTGSSTLWPVARCTSVKLTSSPSVV